LKPSNWSNCGGGGGGGLCEFGCEVMRFGGGEELIEKGFGRRKS